MDLKVYLPEIDAIAGAEIQSQLRDAFANWLDIAKYAVFKAINANADSGSGLNVEAIEPIRKWFAAGLVLTDENFSGSGFQIRWATSHCVTFKSHFKRSTILRLFQVKSKHASGKCWGAATAVTQRGGSGFATMLRGARWCCFVVGCGGRIRIDWDSNSQRRDRRLTAALSDIRGLASSLDSCYAHWYPNRFGSYSPRQMRIGYRGPAGSCWCPYSWLGPTKK